MMARKSRPSPVLAAALGGMGATKSGYPHSQAVSGVLLGASKVWLEQGRAE